MINELIINDKNIHDMFATRTRITATLVHHRYAFTADSINSLGDLIQRLKHDYRNEKCKYVRPIISTFIQELIEKKKKQRVILKRLEVILKDNGIYDRAADTKSRGIKSPKGN